MWTLYILQLEDNCYYVGITQNTKRRFAQHFEGTGARWTQLHTPIRVAREKALGHSDKARALALEDAVTLALMKKKGKEFVRGGKWCCTFDPDYRPFDKVGFSDEFDNFSQCEYRAEVVRQNCAREAAESLKFATPVIDEYIWP